jgi:methylaspartate mutase epsilon subunit
MEIRDRRLGDKEFFRERQEVLSGWPTGKELDLDEAITYYKSLPPSNNYVLKLAEAKRKGELLLQGAEGADTLEKHIELLQYVQDEGQADLLSTWTDALTRNHRYEEAERAVNEAERTGRVVLNGLPVVHYGVAGIRKLIESIRIPVSIYANGPDMRLIAEIALAGGHTATTFGGALCAFWGYTSDLPLEAVIRNYQYLYRLEGYYEESGASICVQTIGSVSGIIAPSMKLASSIIEAMIGAGQGVKHVQLYSSTNGNLAQDIACIITIRKLGREYMDKFGHKDVAISVASHHPDGVKFPTDEAQAFVIIGWSAMVAVLGGSDVAQFFTVDEGRQIPRKEKNAASHKHVRMMMNWIKNQKIDLLNNRDVKIETEMVEKEVRAIIDKVIDLGNGDIVTGAVRAVEAGVLDMPFATTQKTHSKVLGVRDARGAVRYLDHGNLPFTNDIVQFHKEKIAERAKIDGRKIGYDAVIGDIYAPSMGNLISSPGWHQEEPT